MLLTLTNPYNGNIVGELAYDNQKNIEHKLQLATLAYEHWKTQPLEQRIEKIHGALQYFKTHRLQIATEITSQMGKPITESNREMDVFLKRAYHLVSIAEESLSPELLPEKRGVHRRIEHFPLGIILNIAAWNYPLLIAVNVVIPALLAGNVVLLKHSALTPLCGLHFEKAFNSVFQGLVNNMILTHEQTNKLVQDSRIAHIAFTGSVEGGKQIYTSLAERIVTCGMELGGKDAAYIAQDSDLDFSVPNIVEGACYNAGQSCCAIERVYVHKSKFDEFLEKASAIVEKIKLGDPLQTETEIGPLASASAPAFLQSQIDDAIKKGAKVIATGAQMTESKGSFFAPVLIANTPNNSRIMQEESFGPVIPVARVLDDDEAIQKINDSPFGLTASIWTNDRQRSESFARSIHAGTIFQNRCDYLDPGLPWTGVKNSGFGSTLSSYGFIQLTHRKSIHFRDS